MVYLIRHGETEWNKEKIIQGSVNDEPLNGRGVGQAKKLAFYFNDKHMDLIISSPLKRAKQTAFFVGTNKKLKILYNKNFTEIDYGEWSGKKRSEIPRLFPNEWKNFVEHPEKFAFRSGESISSLYKRVSEAFDKLEKDKNILIVTHMNPIRMIIAHILHLTIPNAYKLHFDNCTINKIRYEHNRWEVDSLNCKIM